MASWFGDIDEAALRAHFGGEEVDQIATRYDASEVGDVVACAFVDARAEAGSYIALRYRLGADVLATPQSLKRIVCDLARYRLYDDAPNDEVQARYKKSIAELQAIVDGDRGLFDTDADLLADWLAIDTLGTNQGARILAAAPKRKLYMTDQQLKGYPG